MPLQSGCWRPCPYGRYLFRGLRVQRAYCTKGPKGGEAAAHLQRTQRRGPARAGAACHFGSAHGGLTSPDHSSLLPPAVRVCTRSSNRLGCAACRSRTLSLSQNGPEPRLQHCRTLRCNGTLGTPLIVRGKTTGCLLTGLPLLAISFSLSLALCLLLLYPLLLLPLGLLLFLGLDRLELVHGLTIVLKRLADNLHYACSQRHLKVPNRVQ
mmetsp:Transcript_47851/g.152658  ORF Transcript_47851/g.152658 Transcript_47851/m.152658 type:complete len:210 (-) Transcript_47851:463-1092(-)